MGKPQRITDDDVVHAINADYGFSFGFFDIETTSLNASFGHILTNTVVGIRQEDKPIVRRIDLTSTYKKEPWNDSQLCSLIKSDLEKFDVLVSYNGYRFDIPFINSRAVANKLKILDTRIKHVDLFAVTKHRMILNSSSLDSLLTHLQTEERKTPLDAELWKRAIAGDKKSMDMIVKHNIQDVLALREAFRELKQFLDVQFRLVR